MKNLNISTEFGIATVTMDRGKVNALDETMVVELRELFAALADDADTRAIVLTGQGKFFSFGFDVPRFFDHTPEAFADFLRSFCDLSRQMFLFPKPLIAAINGHCTAGGCLLALTCDCRVMVDDRAKIGLNEVTFGSSIFASSVEMLRHTVGGVKAEEVLLTGKLYSPAEALGLGLVDELVPGGKLMETARSHARERGALNAAAYAQLKRLLRQPVVDDWMQREQASIEEFVNIWYSPATRAMTRNIQIRS